MLYKYHILKVHILINFKHSNMFSNLSKYMNSILVILIIFLINLSKQHNINNISHSVLIY